MDEPEVDAELDDYIEGIIKKVTSELSRIYPNDDQDSVEFEFDQSDLVNQRPKTTSSLKGKKTPTEKLVNDDDDESVTNLSVNSNESELKELLVERSVYSPKVESKTSESKRGKRRSDSRKDSDVSTPESKPSSRSSKNSTRNDILKVLTPIERPESKASSKSNKTPDSLLEINVSKATKTDRASSKTTSSGKTTPDNVSLNASVAGSSSKASTTPDSHKKSENAVVAVRAHSKAASSGKTSPDSQKENETGVIAARAGSKASSSGKTTPDSEKESENAVVAVRAHSKAASSGKTSPDSQKNSFQLSPSVTIASRRTPDEQDDDDVSKSKIYAAPIDLLEIKSSNNISLTPVVMERSNSRLLSRNSKTPDCKNAVVDVVRKSSASFREKNHACTSTTEMTNETKNVKNKKLQVDLMPKREKSRQRNRRNLTDSYQLFDESFLVEKDVAVQTQHADTPYYVAARKEMQNTVGVQASSTEPIDEDKRLLKRQKSRKNNLDYRRIFYYYHEELRKLQNHAPRVDKSLENHFNRMKSANKNILKEEMYENNDNNGLIPVVYSVDSEFRRSTDFYSPENDIGGFGTDSVKLSKIAYDVRKDEVRLRNRLIYGCSRATNSQSFEPKYLTSKRQFLPFGTILKVPSLNLGHQKGKLTMEGERDLIARLHDSHISLTRKKEIGSS